MRYLEEVQIGKAIFESHPEQYTVARMNVLKDDVERLLPNSSREEKENFFFHSIYDYWVYGNNIREEKFYSFYEKSDKERSEYITFRNRFNYYHILNNPAKEMILKKNTKHIHTLRNGMEGI